MIYHPYARDRRGHREAYERSAWYFTAGYADPRTYTFEPWAYARATGSTLSVGFGVSLTMAAYVAWTTAAMGYMGFDPMNVTPGYGMSPGDHRDIHGDKIDPFEIKPHFLM